MTDKTENMQRTIDDMAAGIPARDAEIVALREATQTTPTSSTVEQAQHPDDVAVDAFAAAMKSKLARKRNEGRDGWQDKTQCSQDRLSDLLRQHAGKGDPVDVANFCMMLYQRGELIAQQDADMFWDDNDSEQCYTSIHDAVTDIDGYVGFEVGSEITLQCAKRLPNLTIRITSVPAGDSYDSYDSVKYEEINATTQQGGRS